MIHFPLPESKKSGRIGFLQTDRDNASPFRGTSAEQLIEGPDEKTMSVPNFRSMLILVDKIYV